MSESVTLKSYFYEVLIPSSQKNTSSPIEDILHHVSKYIFYEKACALQMFQSTHPHGVRPNRLDYKYDTLLFQSTHPHGVRRLTTTSLRWATSFNPRTHTGYDMAFISPFIMANKFQSTHPHGVRPLFLLYPACRNLVSIHAPTRGTTYF